MRILAKILGGFPIGNLGELFRRIPQEIHEGTSGGILSEIPGGFMYGIFIWNP